MHLYTWNGLHVIYIGTGALLELFTIYGNIKLKFKDWRKIQERGIKLLDLITFAT